MRRLKGKKQIGLLFEEGRSVNAFPFRVIFSKSSETMIGVSVSKRNFKLAIHRNKIKRQMRAALKLHFWPTLSKLSTKYVVMMIYTGKEKPEWNQILIKVKEAVNKFKQKVS